MVVILILVAIVIIALFIKKSLKNTDNYYDSFSDDIMLPVVNNIFGTNLGITNFFCKDIDSITLFESISSDEIKKQKNYERLISAETDENKRNLLEKEMDEFVYEAKRKQWCLVFRYIYKIGAIKLFIDDLKRLLYDKDETLVIEYDNNRKLTANEIKEKVKKSIAMGEKAILVYENLITEMPIPSAHNINKFLMKYDCKTEDEFLIKYESDYEKKLLFFNEKSTMNKHIEFIEYSVFYCEEFDSTESKYENVLKEIEKFYIEEEKKEKEGLLSEDFILIASDLMAMLSSYFIHELYRSRKGLIGYMEELYDFMSDGEERIIIKERIDNYKYKNEILKMIEKELSDTYSSADEFKNKLTDLLKNYFSDDIYNGAVEKLTEYYEDYRYKHRAYDAFLKSDNSNFIETVITAKNPLLFELYEKKYQVIEEIINNNSYNDKVLYIIKELYKNRFIIDNDSIDAIMGNKNKKLKIYRLSDKAFGKDEMGNEIMVKYKNELEADKNSFEIIYKLNPFSAEYSIAENVIYQNIKDGIFIPSTISGSSQDIHIQH